MKLYKYINLLNISNKSLLYTHLVNETSYNLEEIEFALYDLFNYEISREVYDIREKRIKQEQFHKEIQERDKQCIVTKRFNKVCQSCHIIPFSICSNEQKYDIDNGLLLSADIHILFDKYLFSINPITSLIVMSDELQQNNDYKQYNNQKIKLTDKQKEYLNHHWALFNEYHPNI